tara:strand:+ start:259 stop:528 length:270 start_codon:yes stop_codon:yes gene_type:complete
MDSKYEHDYHISVGFRGIAVSPLTFYSTVKDIIDEDGNFRFFDAVNNSDVYINGKEIAFYAIKQLTSAEAAAFETHVKAQSEKNLYTSK